MNLVANITFIFFRNTITESEVRNYIDEYLNLLMNAMTEKEFIIDYHEFYPINVDLANVSTLCPEMYPFLKKFLYVYNIFIYSYISHNILS